MNIRKRFVLVSTGTEFIFFLLVGTGLSFGFSKMHFLAQAGWHCHAIGKSADVPAGVHTHTNRGWGAFKTVDGEKNTPEVSSVMYKGEPVHVQQRKGMRSVRMCRN